MFFIILIFIVIVGFLVHKNKQERRISAQKKGDELLYVQTYNFDLMLAANKMVRNRESVECFMEFKRIVLDNNKVLTLIEDQLIGADKRYREELNFLKRDFARLENIAITAQSYSDFHHIIGELESMIVDGFNRKITQTRIMTLKKELEAYHNKNLKELLSSI